MSELGESESKVTQPTGEVVVATTSGCAATLPPEYAMFSVSPKFKSIVGFEQAVPPLAHVAVDVGAGRHAERTRTKRLHVDHIRSRRHAAKRRSGRRRDASTRCCCSCKKTISGAGDFASGLDTVRPKHMHRRPPSGVAIQQQQQQQQHHSSHVQPYLISADRRPHG